MSSQLQRQGIRLRADERSRLPLLDAYTNATPQGWVRAATQFEIALASGGGLVDLGNLFSVTLEAAPYQTRDGARAFSCTLAGAALNNALTEATWADGSAQHALFLFSGAQMNLDLGGAAAADFWLVVTALTTDGNGIVCGTGRLTMRDDGAFTTAPPPQANPGVGLTLDQADLRYARLGEGGGGAFAPAVTSVGSGAATSLEAVPTAALTVPAWLRLYVPGLDQVQDWYLLAGSDAGANGADGQPSCQRPNDFDAVNNAKVWVRK